MRFALLLFAVGVACTPLAHAQDAAKALAKEAMTSKRLPPLSIEALCARLTQDEVAAVVGAHFQRKPEKDALFRGCTYADSKEKGSVPVRYFRLVNSHVSEAGFRRTVEEVSKGKVISRDGVLVSHIRRNKFATDTVWVRDGQGRALELSVNSGVSEDQAVALAKAALN